MTRLISKSLLAICTLAAGALFAPPIATPAQGASDSIPTREEITRLKADIARLYAEVRKLGTNDFGPDGRLMCDPSYSNVDVSSLESAPQISHSKCGPYIRAYIALEKAKAELKRAEDALFPYVVVVNANNPYAGDLKEIKTALRQLFLKARTYWPGQFDSLPYGRSTDHPAFAAFARDILGMSVDELASYWQRFAESSGADPPSEIESARQLFRMISGNKGAFGVIAYSEIDRMPAKVRILYKASPPAAEFDPRRNSSNIYCRPAYEHLGLCRPGTADPNAR